MLLLLLSLTAITAKVIDFNDTPLSCRSLQCPDGSTCMEMPEGAFCWPVFVKQTQVQASIDVSPAEIATARPPKSCATLSCSSDEQCVNTFEGPTCRRVTFDLSKKYMTTTTSSPWSPSPIEEPETVSMFVETETSSPVRHSLRAFPPSPPAPPSAWRHAMEKTVESGDMPPTSFRKPTVPDSCDRVHCPVGQSCFMKEVKCFTVPCLPVPYCREEMQ